MKKLIKIAAVFCVTASLGEWSALSQPVQVQVDEYGVGSIKGGPFGPNPVPLASGLMPDPTGGLLGWNVLVYNLPFPGVAGDVLMHDFTLADPFFDVLRFDGQGHVIFYSDNVDGYDAPADTPAPPSPLLANQPHILEQGPEGGFQFGTYTPNVNQPGWDPSAPQYMFISDYAVPEPESLALALCGFSALLLRRKLAA